MAIGLSLKTMLKYYSVHLTIRLTNFFLCFLLPLIARRLITVVFFHINFLSDDWVTF